MKNLSIELVKAKNGNEESKLYFLEKFKPLLNKYARLAKTEDGLHELTLYMLITINVMPKLNTDEQIVSYLSTAIRNYSYKIVKNHEILYFNDILIESDIKDENNAYNEIDDALFFDSILSRLTPKQATIIYELFVTGTSDKKISEMLKISKQSVYNTKVRALNKLKPFFSNEMA